MPSRSMNLKAAQVALQLEGVVMVARHYAAGGEHEPALFGALDSPR
jgi:hypothetical protein